jgi:hypothetical protein
MGAMEELILYEIYVDVCTASSPVCSSPHAGSLQDIWQSTFVLSVTQPPAE